MSDSSASPLSLNVFNRRRFLQAGGLAAISWLASSPLARQALGAQEIETPPATPQEPSEVSRSSSKFGGDGQGR